MLVEPKIVGEAVIVLLVRLINRFVLVSAIVVSKGGHDHGLREVFLKLFEGLGHVVLDRTVVGALRIISLSSSSDTMRV